MPGHRVCPWWIGYLLASPMRRWLGQDPIKILTPYVHEGMNVLEPGPGMGFFTIPLARLVGASGKVIAVDLQPKMIASLKKRAAKVKVLDRIDARVTSADKCSSVRLRFILEPNALTMTVPRIATASRAATRATALLMPEAVPA